ncbi:hypothetical protein NP233_g5653 [Leucocoprinus birnbaumii]|uniref:FAD-binding PCMH-type domain-containing protein n=1 Tax=Leucocoprinus birnbaumii TaxID=56174 RepID=A0AAD5VTP9_9AGAR|nr:hypothetical protein NP233_g5653 [Leucocoprinus birnbaumii]
MDDPNTSETHSTTGGFLSRIKGDIITPEHPDYRQSLHRWARNAERNAAFVIFVKDEADVSTAILFAKENKLPIAIRGGGHSPIGASSVEGGVVIDLSRYLNKVRIDPAKRLAYVGGGAVWEEVGKTTIVHGLEQTRKKILIYSLAILWPPYSQRDTVFSGTVIFHGKQLESLVAVTKEWNSNGSPKEAMMFVLTCDPTGVPIILCQSFFNGSEKEVREKFKKLYDVGPVADMTKEVPYETPNPLQNPYVRPGNGAYWKGVAHKGPDLQPMVNAHQKATEISQGGKTYVQVVYEWFHLFKINSVPAGATAYRRIPDPNCSVIIGWPGEAHSDEKVDETRTFAHRIADCIAGGESNLKDVKSQGYANYDPEGVLGDKNEVKDKAQVAFGDNYPALQRVKKKYDPDNICNRWFAITPA